MTITPQYIDDNMVFVKKGFWVEHIFIDPGFIGKGISCLYIFSDPYAVGFYDNIGANYCGESPSSIEGRTVALYQLKISMED